MDLFLLYLYAYLIGSVPTAYLIGRLVKGIDIRQFGSGNVGGSNVFPHVGKWWTAVLSIFEIFVKGASPIWIGIHLFGISIEGPTGSNFLNYTLGFDRSSASLAGAGVLAIVGNNWSVFLKFQGGRGFVVASGTALAFAFYQLLIFIAGALLGLKIFRNSAIVNLVSLSLLPLWTYLMGQSSTIIWYSAAVAGLVVLKRLTSNWTPLPKDLSVNRVFWNRLIRDRDVESRDEWLSRVPINKNCA
ncbi:glycerol-3-phosphate acyltransferase [SAR202 cluster bacterium AD-804-J14_MRT_500m]|nr:glycerol-3-phosphate acyltransferase [SAR202 cluster bacterium AD-804-J14_MRT_500m]